MKQMKDKLIKKRIHKEETMKTTMTFRALLMAAVMAFVLPTVTFAVSAGVTAGATVSNTATLSYSVGGSAQGNILSSPDGLTPGGVATSFVVDNLVQFAVATGDTQAVTVAPGQSDAYLTFTLVNNGNKVQDFLLTSVAGTNTAFTTTNGDGVDDFDGTVSGTTEFYIDSNLSGVYDAGVDQPISYIDELDPTDPAVTIFLVLDIPAAQPAGDESTYYMNAQVAVGGTASAAGAAIAADDSGAIDTTLEQVVFNDAISASAQPLAADLVKDGEHSDQSDFIVASALISLSKTATTVWDPVNWTTNPKAIPGALIEYDITVTNSSGATSSATLTQITDALVAAVVPDVDLDAPAASATLSAESGAAIGFKIVYGGTAAARRTDEYTNNAGAQGTTMAGQNITIDFATLLPAADHVDYTVDGELAPGDSVSVIFRAYVQ